MTPKQERFVQEYLLDLNASQAAVRAGYSSKNANVVGSRLLANVGISVAIRKAQEERVARTGIDQARVLLELEGLAFSDLTHYIVDDGGNVQLSADAPDGAMRALQSIKRKMTTRGSGKEAITTHEVEIRLWDKPGPLKLAGQHVGLFVDRHEISGPGGNPIEVQEIRESLTRKLAGLAARLGAGTVAGESDRR